MHARVAFGIALIGYTVFPTAPPRFLPEWGFIDTVAQFTGVPQDSVTVDALFNPYAAVPSMHAGFAIMIGWPLATLLGYIGARFRDLPHALGLVFQAFWFVSPIYFEPKVFRGGGLDGLVDYNPIHHLLQIVRAPLLHGEWPTLENYGYCFGLIAIITLLAVLMGRSAEKKVIFYL